LNLLSEKNGDRVMSSQVPNYYSQDERVLNKRMEINPKRIWAVILAGGNGDRIVELTHGWLGRPVPKQYCAFVGTRSMLEHTISRADKLAQREQQLTIVARAHQSEAQLQLADRWPSGIIVQPANKDTLPGIFLPLTHVYVRDSKATVMIFPSDHFIHPENNFYQVMEKALQAAEELPDMVVLVGAPALSLQLEYGWICPGDQIWSAENHSVRAVKRFLEKPSISYASEAMACGGLWNTMIVVAKAKTLWQLGWHYCPEVLKHFERLGSAIGTSREEAALEAIYEVMPSRNFSSDLLTPAAGRTGVISMEGVLWSDWGRKERIVETLGCLGKLPNFLMVSATGNKAQTKTVQELSIAS
jgi:mannose-1-phosphate guanylyltransferase